MSRASRSYAEQGEGRLALLAQWATDLEVLHQLLWENGLDESADASEQLAAVGEAILTSMASVASDDFPDRTTRETAEAFRSAVVETFDQSVHPLLEERWPTLDHLDGIAASYEHARGEALALLAGHTPAALVLDLRATAEDCMAVAQLMIDEGDVDGAIRQLWQADLARFEAHLIEVARRAGDTELVTVQLRWEIARRLVPGPPSVPTEEVTEPVLTWRQQLTSVLSSAEAASLGASGLFVPLR